MTPAMFGRAGLELVGQVVVGGLLEGDRADHVAAALIRRHRFQQRGLAVEHADAGRAEHLVPGEGVEIAIERLHVDRADAAPPARHRPAPERPCACASSMICCTGLTVPSALETCVTATSFVRGPSRRCELVQHQLAAIVDRHDLQHGARLLAQHLPRDDVGVVLHRGDQDLVAGPTVRRAIALRDQVDGLGRAADEDDLFAFGAR